MTLGIAAKRSTKNATGCRSHDGANSERKTDTPIARGEERQPELVQRRPAGEKNLERDEGEENRNADREHPDNAGVDAVAERRPPDSPFNAVATGRRGLRAAGHDRRRRRRGHRVTHEPTLME